MASDPVAVVLLVGLGVRQLSMSSARLPLIKRLIRSLSVESAQSLARQALAIESAAEIRRLGLQYLDSLDSGSRLLQVHS